MASGDISAIKVLYRQPLGGGRTSSGGVKNQKVLVVGEITATWADSGIAVNKPGGDIAFGVDTIDVLKLQTISIGIAGTAAYPDASKLKPLSYDVKNKKIFSVIDQGQSTPANPVAGQTVIFRFFCIGDSAEAPELT